MLWDTLNILVDYNCWYAGIFRLAFDCDSVVLVFADKHFLLGGEIAAGGAIYIGWQYIKTTVH